MDALIFNDRRPLAEIGKFAKLFAWRDRGPLSIPLMIHDRRLERVVEFDRRHQVAVSFDELAEEAGALELFGSLVSDASVRLGYQPIGDTPERIDGSLAYMAVEVGEWRFSALACQDRRAPPPRPAGSPPARRPGSSVFRRRASARPSKPTTRPLWRG
jgi:hypothetical protein